MISLSQMTNCTIKRKVNFLLIISAVLITLPALIFAQKKSITVEVSDSMDYKKGIELKNVDIYNKKTKIKKLGTYSFTSMMWAAATNSAKNRVYELARLITIDKPTKLLSVNAICGGQKSEDSVTYRLHIYRIKDGYPDSKLIEKDFIKKFPVTSKKLSFDLRQEEIILNEDFAVSFEYIPKKEPAIYPMLSFRAKLNGKDSYRKDTRNGQWRKAEGGCAAIYVEVEE